MRKWRSPFDWSYMTFPHSNLKEHMFLEMQQTVLVYYTTTGGSIQWWIMKIHMVLQYNIEWEKILPKHQVSIFRNYENLQFLLLISERKTS